MANAVNVNFRMDPDLKRSMEEVCAEMGLSMTTAFTIFAKKVSREHRIPFEVSADPFYSESNINHLRQIVHAIPFLQLIIYHIFRSFASVFYFNLKIAAIFLPWGSIRISSRTKPRTACVPGSSFS